MAKPYFRFDNYRMDYYGLTLQRPLRVSGMERIVKKVHIPGRDGDIIFDTGAYKNRTAEADCFCLHGDVATRMDRISSILLKKPGYQQLMSSTDPKHFYLARVANGPQIVNTMGILNEFTIKFECQPRRFRVDGEQAITDTRIPTNGPIDTTITNPGTGDALPIIEVYGTGSAMLYNEGTYTKLVILSLAGDDVPVTIDCAAQTAKSGGSSWDGKISVMNQEFIYFKPGTQTFRYFGSGVKKIVIKPRWWDL